MDFGQKSESEDISEESESLQNGLTDKQRDTIKHFENLNSKFHLGIIELFSVQRPRKAVQFFESVHEKEPGFKLNSLLLYVSKKILSLKTSELYNDILSWKLEKNCKLIQKVKLFFESICFTNSNASFVLGIAYHVVKEFELAKFYFQTSVVVNEHYCLGWRYLAGILRDHYSDYDTTRKIYEKVLVDIDPICVQVLYNKGFLLKNEFKEYESAKECFEECIRLDSCHISALNRLADLYLTHFRDYKLAELYNRRALQIDPNHFRSYVDLGHLYRKELNKRALARDYYERAIQLRPYEHRVYASLGKLLRKSYYDYEGAKNQYCKALELAPRSSRTHLEMG
eukprot:UN34661